MHIAYLLLGGNQGNVIESFTQVRELLLTKSVEILQKSSIYQSPAWGFQSDDYFFNQVIQVKTNLNAQELLDCALEIEQKLGRTRSVNTNVYSSRKIDIDILFFDNQVINESQLIVPHPRLHLRKFTLLPLDEIAKDLLHPIFNLSISELLQNCEDSSEVSKIFH
jgi:2-amino-4-hydroxy-6-hydroxymethyldihydropteridine diphosphokinase